MSIRIEILVLIIITTVVTILPRIIPFIFVKKMQLTPIIQKWLSFIPICILTAFLVQTLFINDNRQLYLNIEQLIVVVPTLLVAIFTRSLSKTVVVGVVIMALVRLFI